MFQAEWPIAALVLAFLVYELISVRRTIRARQKAAADAKARPAEAPPDPLTR